MILPYKKLRFRADIPLPETELLRIWKGASAARAETAKGRGLRFAGRLPGRGAPYFDGKQQ